ncbi:recombination regulator RecX [Streptomyces sp. 11x1]|uniref:recombination regulator RecX n=1 Tax=Streptomyces sp. 11x1 TaxID=3038642 RepID=UPI00292EF085|nr:recombination regulator RecX [Streptomyces sp. 11x1]WNZ08251.1 recombination regulator RecX [Streptomyces sp. 11x1]
MTRRTDWGEYAYPSAPETRGRGGTGGGTGGFGADRHGDEEFRPYDDGGDGDVVRREDGPRSEGPAVGSRRRGGGPSRGAGGDARGRRGGRGGRRRGFREQGDGPDDGGPQDEGSSFSSRAEKGESSGDPAERARAICLRLLTGTPRTRKQLADALQKREIPEDVAQEVLSRFEEVGLINDSAFADAWVESRHHGRGLARRALARELRTKGVDSALIDEAVSQLDSEQEETTARELVARKLRSTRGLDRDKRLRRLAGMLARKGYAEGMALRVVRQALEEEGEETEGLEDEGY